MAVTIKDIAKKVGVNPSTVSRVINGNSSISEETKERILSAMKELNYHPNRLGRSLVNGSTFTIGLVIDTGKNDAFANAFFIQSISAIEVVAEENGYNLLITNTSNKRNPNTVQDLILEHKVDGIILSVAGITEDLENLLMENHFPFVVMGEMEHKIEGAFWVDMDNEQGSRAAVVHLLEQGYKHPVLFVENRINLFEKKRILGFEKMMTEKKILWNEEDIVECGSEREKIEVNIRHFLKEYHHYDSIICTNNIVAYHTLCQLKKGGKKIPQDVGIITFDNYPLSEFMEPALSVVNVDTYRMGEQAAILLFDKIKNQHKEYENTLISTEIIQRESTQKRKGD